MTARDGYKLDQEEMELRKGPWTIDEDTLLIHYIAFHGEGRWNLLANRSGLRRTGKSCRLRWLNYLKPDVKRGNLSPEEQILILDLHSKWGNRWSRIAQHLPGRTDNEIKNYWRTRVQKQAKQLKIDVNSVMFRDMVRCFWMPRLVQSMGSSQTLVSSPILRPNPPIQAQDEQVIFPSLVQSQALLDEISTSNYDMVQRPQDHGCQLATCGSCQQLVGYGFGDLVPIAMGGIGLEASDGSMMLEVEGDVAVRSPWESMDELWQVMTATSIVD